MSSLNKKQFKQYIENFDFTVLFNHLGWSYLDEKTPVKLKEETFLFHSVAEKGGFRVLVFVPSQNQTLPNYSVRLQLDSKIGKLYREHLIIFCDKNNSTQIWQLNVKQIGKPSRLSETRWHKGQEPELLYQKTSSLFFTLDQEENITIADVVDAVNENFSKNIEQVTKKFYENFRKEHKKFIEFIKGISTATDREWYASLMLNRLMFCYFIQKKGFLDNNKNYLRDKLNACKAKKGKVKFYSFYRDFLLVLFHKGLNEPKQSQSTLIEIGKIPYLNGGLFDEHELEKNNSGIVIDDKAFERLFDFFDQYEWHLDTRHNASGKDINPDVIGYIFEKYINDRANMGAYYTKEDITDYISKNCILPYLFDETKRHYPKAFNADAELWQIVKQSGDLYIYDAVKKGVNEPLPKEIEQGIKDVSKRTEWNKPATINYALPTEIWREVVDRRNRFTEVKSKIDKGDIQHINDFITYNLNIRQFAQDVVENTNDPELLKHFYKALNSVTIIDPTCGSGAFLFAAMNILEPLYESCLQRMENFVAEAPKGKYKFFEETLAQVKSPKHPNLQYFIYKSIILRNLYGVDIMKEAVEIAKLRLFLKLVATVEADYRKPNLGLEPLPDIDFNIRAGNTLVGFATEAELQKGLTYTIDGVLAKPAIEEKCEIVANAFKRYKEIQLTYGDDFKEFKKAKAELNKRLKELNHELNQLLHKQASGLKYDNWLKSHQPFHWFAEFYEIINYRKGFDVIIGNPPYVEYSKVKDIYKLNGYKTEKCANLYAFVFERSHLISKNVIGLIIQLSAISTETMKPLQVFLKNNFKNIYSSCFPERPKQLFDGACIALTIQICFKEGNERIIYSGGINRTAEKAREYLFQNISHTKIGNEFIPKQDLFPKFKLNIEKNIFSKIFKEKQLFNYISTKSSSSNTIFYRTAGGRYWKIFLNRNFKNISTSNKSKSFDTKYSKNVIIAILNSNLFWWYFANFFDLYNLKDYMIFSFPFSFKNDSQVIEKMGLKLMKSFDQNVETKEQYIQSKSQTTYFETFNPALSKEIIDEIDILLAKHYGFSAEELDFIINYDIKYRINKEIDEE
jgi:hypothetical protein